jgi:hypothetical protein
MMRFSNIGADAGDDNCCQTIADEVYAGAAHGTKEELRIKN